MANAKNTLVQRIALTGGADIEAELASLGSVGEAAFKSLQAAAIKLAASTTPLNLALKDVEAELALVAAEAKVVGKSFTEFGTAAKESVEKIGLVTAAVGVAVAGFVELVKSSAEAADAVGRNAKATGLSTAAYQKLQFAFGQGEVNAEAFGTAMRKLNTDISQAGAGAKGSTTQLSNAVADAADAAASGNRQLNDSLAAVAASTKKGVTAYAADIKAVAAGTAVDSKKMAADLAQSQSGSVDSLRSLANTQASVAEASEKSQRTVADAQEKANANTSAGAKIFAQLGIAVTQANGELRPTEAIIGDIAEKFKSMPDGANKSALAVELFGRAGAQMIPILDKGRAGLVLFGAEAEKLGVVLTDDQVKAGTDFNESLIKLSTTIGHLKIDFGLLFAPALTEAFDKLTELVATNRQAFLNFGNSLAQQVGPAIADIFSLLEGRDGDVKNKNLLAIKATVLDAVAAFKLLYSVVSFVFTSIENAIDPLVQIFNTVFGTHFTSQQVVIALVLGQLLGVFKLLGAGAEAAEVSYGALVKLFGESAPVIGRVIGVTAAVLGAFGALKTALDDIFNGLFDSLDAGAASSSAFFQSAFTGAINTIGSFVNALVSGVQSAINDIVNFFSTGGTSIVAAFKSAIQSVGQFFVNLYKFVADDIVPLIVKSIQNALAQLTKAAANAVNFGGTFSGSGSSSSAPQTHATGGHIRGAGSGTSDSILSWLSNGEFVVKTAAVRRYGLGFMHALNSMRLPKSGFSLGGMAGVSSRPSFGGIPSFASGGAAGRPLSLTIGGETFLGLLAPETVAEKLSRFATKKHVSSAGRKPSWYGGSKAK